MLRSFDLTGKVALVTGAKRGIGKGIAVALAEAGADIIGVSASQEPTGSEVEKTVQAAGKKFYGYTCDMGNREALYAFIKEVTSRFPVIDILVNNAGTILRAPAAEHPDEYWDEVLGINLDAPFILTREIGKQMLSRGRGKIIFTASLLTFQGGINVPGYAASKGAVGSLVKAFANEWAGKGVHVNAIAPGYIATDNTAALRADEDRSTAILSRIPAGRWGTPKDFQGPAVFLASAASDYVHGTILTVDGGWMGR
ncbi:SDR family oxidoreductase [Chitinophaga sancti]|uniref:SDR family oxidoreductase n=1 Tax=Chitinophaga sancti TaxID=1004 RepID=UPI002A74DF56|nr:SDR family oxidoreductase [Chitinophaga sancti]WPQ66593.1 SDR family oxidoreductase [Chitinophaga sancti]